VFDALHGCAELPVAAKLRREVLVSKLTLEDRLLRENPLLRVACTLRGSCTARWGIEVSLSSRFRATSSSCHSETGWQPQVPAGCSSLPQHLPLSEGPQHVLCSLDEQHEVSAAS